MKEEVIGNVISWVDYLMFAGVIVISTGIGVVFMILQRKQKNASDLVNATRSFGLIPVSLSITATYASAITVLGNPVEIYMNGTMYMYLVISLFMVVGLSNLIFVPVFFESGFTSCYEYLHHRFNKAQKIIISIVFMVQTIIYQGIVLYAPSLAIAQVTGFTLWGSVVTVGVACSIYTSLGGLKAVIWTDVFQVIVMFITLAMPLIKGSIDHEGFANVWKVSQDNGRIAFDNFSIDPTVTYSFWSVMVGGTILWLVVFGVNQAMIQRILSVKTLKQARLAYWASVLGFSYILITSFLSGLVLYAEYGECNPLWMNNSITASDQILPYYIYTKLHGKPGLLGIFIAGITSAGLSTISSGTNSLVAVTINDLCPDLFVQLTPMKKMIISKSLGFFFGGLTLLFAYLSSFMGSVLKAALGLFGMLSGPILGVFTLGMLGSITGQIIGTILTLWIGLGKFSYPKADIIKMNGTCDKFNKSLNLLNSPYPTNHHEGIKNLYQISFLYLSVIGLSTTFIIGIVISLATG